jgi:hypothetical protein
LDLSRNRDGWQGACHNEQRFAASRPGQHQQNVAMMLLILVVVAALIVIAAGIVAGRSGGPAARRWARLWV